MGTSSLNSLDVKYLTNNKMENSTFSFLNTNYPLKNTNYLNTDIYKIVKILLITFLENFAFYY